MRTDPAVAPDDAACSGCSLCLLVCPVWRRSRDLALTAHGRAKALQNGVAAAELSASIESCTLCGACGPVCPERIDPVDRVLALRRELAPTLAPPAAPQDAAPQLAVKAARVLLCDAGLRAQPDTLAKILALLGNGLQVAQDDGSDIALALESGALIAEPRLQQFLALLRDAGGLREIVVADGLLCRALARSLPGVRIVSLGAALSAQARVRRALRATDLYVIEPRAYHADYAQLVQHYDRLRRDCGCELNLDLQRIAIPATARSLPQRLGDEAADDLGQLRWLLQGRSMKRIVAESLADCAALAQASACPVVHVADLAAEAG